MPFSLNLIHDLGRLFFPHRCAGCGGDVPDRSSPICLQCLHALPVTEHHLQPGNAPEQLFMGRLRIAAAASYCYMVRQQMMHALIHSIKYEGNRGLALLLGRMMGYRLRESPRFSTIEMLVPVPLYRERERERGYNQSALLCEGMAEVLGLPVVTGVLKRLSPTGTQTHKNRMERWQNMLENFRLTGADVIEGRHVLLVDDVITTGATLEACGRLLLKAPGVRLSVASLAWADS
ncbi:MAG: ComF family protein [Bacteroidetes bacterium]|nr:ComF family protein [Bacteroidota bacterium]